MCVSLKLLGTGSKWYIYILQFSKTREKNSTTLWCCSSTLTKARVQSSQVALHFYQTRRRHISCLNTRHILTSLQRVQEKGGNSGPRRRRQHFFQQQGHVDLQQAEVWGADRRRDCNHPTSACFGKHSVPWCGTCQLVRTAALVRHSGVLAA